MPAEGTRIEVVRDRLTGDLADEVLDFLSRESGLESEAARLRLSDVVCVARDGDTIVAIDAVHSQPVTLVGGRTFWIYRNTLDGDYGETWTEMFSAALEAMSGEGDSDGAGPVGLCVIVGDREEMRRRPDAVWPDSELLFAGWLEGGRQVRIRYLWDATIGPGFPDSPSHDTSPGRDFPLDDRYRIEPLGEENGVSADDVLRLWAREEAMPEEEAARRVHEVQLVATERDEGVVAVSTAPLQRNPQLRMDVWWYRSFVARAHRESNLAGHLFLRNWDRFEQRYESGEDSRAAGMLFELENDGLKRYANRGLWRFANFTFIGETTRGSHVRVRYFPGARIPVPDDPEHGAEWTR